MNTSGHIGREAQFLEKLRQIVLENLQNEQFGVESLAESIGISRSQLHRKLRKLEKKSISRFIREIRLEEAYKMLQEDLGTVSEIAYKVGFSSSTYFNTCFSEYFGYPPGEAKIRPLSGHENQVSVDRLTVPRKRVLESNKSYWIVGFMSVVLVIIGLLVFRKQNDNGVKGVESQLIREDNKKISIAILPLTNWSGDPQLDYISFGITDAVITRISHLNSIGRLIPFNTILGYAGSDLSPRELAEELDVDFLIEGNYQISGNNIKVKIQLVNPKLDKQTNTNEYFGQWKEEELFLLQSNIAEGVVELLEVELSDNEIDILAQIPTNNEAAYTLYLKGYYQALKSNEEGFQNALPLFEEAISLDNNFIEPYIEMVRIWMTSGMVWGVVEQQIAWANAKKIINEALPLVKNKNHFEQLNGFLCRGHFYYELNFDCVEEQYEKYLDGDLERLDPAIRIDYVRKSGRFHKALELVEESIKSYPNLGSNYAAKAIAYYFLDQQQEALELLEKSNNLYNDSFFYLMESGKLYYYLGEYDYMERQIHDISRKFPDRPPLIIWLGLINAKEKNDSSEIDLHKSQLLSDYENKAPGSPAWFLALYYAHIGDEDKTFEWLQKSYEAHEVEMTWLKEEPLLRPLRSDPRYIDLYHKVGFPFPISQTTEFKP